MCTSNQFFEQEYRKWCEEFQSPPRFNRQQWEYVFILEAVRQADNIENGKKGLGFGCGREPLTAVFAKNGCSITATDKKPGKEADQLWVKTYQHADSLSNLNELRICDPITFKTKVEFKYVDMNMIPDELTGYDFLWSACALEHLGSIQNSLDFAVKSLKCLKPGGIAVHTTEFNISSDDETYDGPNLSILRKRDLEELSERLIILDAGMAYLNLNPGNNPIDQYVDTPPYKSSPNLKILLNSIIATSLGFIIYKAK
jgi:2-polyprenyl-3-methyl-5-hydroxy-6-metoxy-1,4-benzoquinol methylase